MADVPRDYLMASPLLMRSALDKCVHTKTFSMYNVLYIVVCPFCPFSFDHCVVCSSDYPFCIFKLFLSVPVFTGFQFIHGTFYKRCWFICDPVYTGFRFMRGSVYTGICFMRGSVYTGFRFIRYSVYI